MRNAMPIHRVQNHSNEILFAKMENKRENTNIYRVFAKHVSVAVHISTNSLVKCENK